MIMMMMKGPGVYLVRVRPVGPGCRSLVPFRSREPHLSLMEMMDGPLGHRASALHQQQRLHSADTYG